LHHTISRNFAFGHQVEPDPAQVAASFENAQAMAAHESPRTTKLYDRRGDEITLDEVERINI
jgi:hypothetical protein